jgi:hypothetical protein
VAGAVDVQRAALGIRLRDARRVEVVVENALEVAGHVEQQAVAVAVALGQVAAEVGGLPSWLLTAPMQIALRIVRPLWPDAAGEAPLRSLLVQLDRLVEGQAGAGDRLVVAACRDAGGVVSRP